MHHHHQRTLEALFAHPVAHGVRTSRVEALLRVLGAEVERLDGQRLRVRMPNGSETWIRRGCGLHHPDLDAESLLRLRQLLSESGISPVHPAAEPPAPRGDQGMRLLVRLDHRGADLYRLSGANGELVEHQLLRPEGTWGTDQNLVHRHDRDVAGQRAPLDHAYLTRLTEEIAAADAVLLLGHGHGESDLRQVLLRHLERHHRNLLERVAGVTGIDDTACSEAELLACAREHFGNLPRRHELHIPGQERAGNPA
jgi:hypothetical protein